MFFSFFIIQANDSYRWLTKNCTRNVLIGNKSINLIIKEIIKSSSVLWNGPLGAFEYKPFDKSSDQVIQFDNFFDFYLKTDEIFHQLSFLKTKILSRSRNIARLFNFKKNEIISKYSSIDKNYIKKMVDLKNPKENFKDLVQLYKVSEEIFRFNKEEFPLQGKFKIFNEELLRKSLYNSSTKTDLSQSLDELLKIID